MLNMTDYHAKALELAAQGDWDAAHRLIQQHSDPLACLIHGYLHRVEGDQWNARYWYRNAREEMPANTLDEEWRRLMGMCGE